MNNKRRISTSWLGWFKKIRALLKMPWVQKISAPLGVVRRIIRPPMVELVTLTGLEKYSQQTLVLNCGLTQQNYYLWLGLLFGDTAIKAKETSQYRLKDVLRNNNRQTDSVKKSLTVVSAKYSDFKSYSDGHWFFIPQWLSGSISIPLPKKYLNQEKIKSDLRRIRQNGFDYVVSNDPNVFDDFYHAMYLPYISKVHGQEAFFDSFAEKRQSTEHYDLLLISKPDHPPRYVAGIMIIYEAEGPRLWSLGVRDDGEDYVRQGAIAALYHFSFQYLLKKGFDHVRTGGSRAFLHDGVLRFKRKMSQAIIGSNWQGYALGIHSLTPAVKSFLLNNPFVFKQGSDLIGAFFVDAELALTEDGVRRIYKNEFHPGLSALIIYCLYAFEPIVSKLIPEELSGIVMIKSIEELLVH